MKSKSSKQQRSIRPLDDPARNSGGPNQERPPPLPAAGVRKAADPEQTAVSKSRPPARPVNGFHKSHGEVSQVARRISEIRYRRLFEAARESVLLVDPATRKITDVNSFMIEFLGYSHEEFVGRELWEIGLLKDQAASQEMFLELRKTHFVPNL